LAVEVPIKIYNSKRKQKNRKKEKESNSTGRVVGRPKGNGISPVRVDCEHTSRTLCRKLLVSQTTRPNFVFFLLFLWIKYKAQLFPNRTYPTNESLKTP
jgi:hypothetical protein